ncbi:hypothetical protein V8E54_007191 [Elaphomyces granulatus]
MVVAQKLYPRATVKRIVKARSGHSLSKNTDILAYARGVDTFKEIRRKGNFCKKYTKGDRGGCLQGICILAFEHDNIDKNH